MNKIPISLMMRSALICASPSAHNQIGSTHIMCCYYTTCHLENEQRVPLPEREALHCSICLPCQKVAAHASVTLFFHVSVTDFFPEQREQIDLMGLCIYGYASQILPACSIQMVEHGLCLKHVTPLLRLIIQTALPQCTAPLTFVGGRPFRGASAQERRKSWKHH